MHYIRYEYLSEVFPRCNVFKLREQAELQTYTLHESLPSIIKKSYEYPKYEHFFLLDESRFSFFRCDITWDFEEPMTIQNLNTLIQDKIRETKTTHNIEWIVVTNYIDTIFVDGEQKQFVIGQKGQIFFRLYIVYLDKKSLNTFNSSYGNVLDYKQVQILPQSFHTIFFLRESLKKENFVLLYITESYCKAVCVKNGFYSGFDTINLGIASLKQMYKDNGVVQYWYQEYQTIESNPLAKSLVVDTIEFYADLLAKWLHEKWLSGSDVVVISPITKNEHFIEIFDKSYRKISNNYIVPFHHSDLLNTFGRARAPEDMDTLIFANQEPKIRKELLWED